MYKHVEVRPPTGRGQIRRACFKGSLPHPQIYNQKYNTKVETGGI